MERRPLKSPLFPYTTLFRSVHGMAGSSATWRHVMPALAERYTVVAPDLLGHGESAKPRSEEHTSELQSQSNLVCRLLLEKKKKSGSAVPQLHQKPDRRTRIH